MDYFLHLKTAHNGSKNLKSIKVRDGITSVGSLPTADFFLEDVEKEQFVLICQNNLVVLHNQALGTTLNSEIIPAGSKKKIEINDEISLKEYVFVLSDEKEAILSSPQLFDINNETFNDSKINSGEAEPPKNSNLNRKFADILESLKEDDDLFFLEFCNDDYGNNKVVLSGEKLMLGWNKKGEIITSDENDIGIELVLFRKDWSGIVAYPQSPKIVWVNGEQLIVPRRLSNNDVLTFSIGNGSFEIKESKVIFSEPESLIAISSFLPKELPLPINFQNGDQPNSYMDISIAPNLESSIPFLTNKDKGGIKSNEKSIISERTLLSRNTGKDIKVEKRHSNIRKKEVIVMFLATLIASIAIFLVLHFMNL